MPELKGSQLYDLSCTLIRLGEPKDLDPAMVLLRRAEKAGYPATEKEIDHVRVKDTDLAPMRKRTDFQEWAKGLKAK